MYTPSPSSPPRLNKSKKSFLNKKTSPLHPQEISPRDDDTKSVAVPLSHPEDIVERTDASTSRSPDTYASDEVAAM